MCLKNKLTHGAESEDDEADEVEDGIYSVLPAVWWVLSCHVHDLARMKEDCVHF